MFRNKNLIDLERVFQGYSTSVAPSVVYVGLFSLAIYELLNQSFWSLYKSRHGEYLQELILWGISLPISLDRFMFLLSLFSLFAIPIILFGLHRIWGRGLIFILIFLYYVASFYQVSGNAGHFLIWSLVPFIFFNKERNWQSIVLVSSQVLVSSIYFMSGFAKTLTVIKEVLFNGNLEYIGGLKYMVAFEYVLNNSKREYLNFLIDIPFIGDLGLLCVILIQLSGPFVILMKPQWKFYLGISYICFHILVYLILGPNFVQAIPVILMLFVVPTIWESIASSNKAT